MNYLEILDYLKSRDMTMSRYEREDWDAFAKRINLSLSVPYIQLTGSNGKGSTANDIYQIYLAHGYKVALFSKPYFDTVREMMQISGKMISETDFARIFNAQAKEIQRSNLSSFEIETYIAFAYFNEQKPDLAIIECGMGGATDSTNLAWDTPLLSIITTISLEHTAFLGRTLGDCLQQRRHHQRQGSLACRPSRRSGRRCAQRALPQPSIGLSGGGRLPQRNV